jgi:hypothetical protein
MSSVETHAVQLVRHLTDLYKQRRFTDLKVWSPTLLFRTYGDSRFRRSTANNSYHPKSRQVRCGGELFEMHASVVTCGSEYFRGMLEHTMAESRSRAFERLPGSFG